MHHTSTTSRWYGYWATLFTLHPRSLDAVLDTPLVTAVTRSRWFAAWSAFIWLAVEIVMHRSVLMTWVATWTLASWLSIVILAMLAMLATAFGVVVLYGFLRLYTLISHVLTLNVLKGRGQRLRLLNVYTTVLPLAAPSAIAVLFQYLDLHSLCVILLSATLAYSVLLLVHGFHLVFHRTHGHAASLLIVSTLLTWFILAIGALAIAVTLGVIGFFVAVVVRAFMHH